jgi:hypothetical protein
MKFHQDLIEAEKFAYRPSGLVLSNIQKESESDDYGAYTFTLNGRLAIFRVAKITPTKMGQFVTLWKRIGTGPILPFDKSDSFDWIIISVRQGNKLGQFVFPKKILLEKGILSDIQNPSAKDGKRAIRVYPPWDIAESKQAQQSQKWQLEYFFLILENQSEPNHPAESFLGALVPKIRKLFELSLPV